MLKPSHKNRRPFAIVMLIMVVWQCWFVAVEASEQFHLPTEPDSHHLATPESDPKPNCPNSDCPGHSDSASDHNLGVASSNGETCDHCCACHGHGAHISIYTRAFWLSIAPSHTQPLIEFPRFYSLHPATIYRPPIV